MALTNSTYGQTGCSERIPISGNLDFLLGSTGTWQFSLSYETSTYLKTLNVGREVLDHQLRERVTQFKLFQFGYSFSNQFSAVVIIPYVRQERTFNQFNITDFTSTNGICGAVLLLKVNISNRSSVKFLFIITTDRKIPTGRSDFKREEGIPLNADLQPGSDSRDGLFCGNGFYKFSFNPTFNNSSTAIFGYKGKNNKYIEDQTYQFGNELQVLFSFNDNFLVEKKILATSLLYRYSKALGDRFNELSVPNTGSQRVFLAQSPGYNFSQKFALNTTFEIPIYGEIVSTQLSLTYRINAGAFFEINKKNELLKI